MNEVLPGVFHWSAEHPNTGSQGHSHYLDLTGTLTDPLIPDEGIEWFDERDVERIILSCRHHIRHAEQIAERFGCPILVHEDGLHQFQDGPEVRGFATGDRLAANVRAVAMNTIAPDDSALHIDAGDGALLFADSITNRDGLGFFSDDLIGDNPGEVKSRTRAQAMRLLEEESFDSLLFAHGPPVIGGGREALAGFAQG